MECVWVHTYRNQKLNGLLTIYYLNYLNPPGNYAKTCDQTQPTYFQQEHIVPDQPSVL